MRRRIVGAFAVGAVLVAGCSQESTGLAQHQLPEPRLAYGDPIDPNAVNDLRVTARDGASVTLTWTQIDGGSGSPAWYRLKYEESPMADWKSATVGCNRTMEGTGIGAEMSCTVDGLSPSVDYDFALMSFRSVDGIWTDPMYSNTASTNVTAEVTEIDVDENKHTLTLGWTEVADYLGRPATYTVKVEATPFDGDPDGGRSQGQCRNIQGSLVGAETTCTLVGLEPDTEYGVQIVAYRVEAGEWIGARKSEVVLARTAALDAPLSVDDVSASFGNLIPDGDSVLVVEWTQVDDGTGGPAAYQVRYDTYPFDFEAAMVGCDEVVGTAIGEPISCTITGLPAGHHIRVQVMSYVGGTQGVDPKLSTIGAGFTDGSPRVTDLRATSVTSTSVELLWTMVEDGTGYPYTGPGPTASYRVKYATPVIGGWSAATRAPGCDWLSGSGRRAFDPRSCTIEGLQPGTTYQLQLMSFQTISAEGGGFTWGAAYYSNLIEVTTDP